MDFSTTGNDSIPSSTNLNSLILESNSLLNQITLSTPNCVDRRLLTKKSNEATPLITSPPDVHQTSCVDSLAKVNPIGTGYNETNTADFQSNRTFQLCAAPWEICQTLHGSLNCQVETFCPNVYVECSYDGCNFAGHLHAKCLHRWTALCHLQCQLLGRHTEAAARSTPSTSADAGGQAKTTLLLTGLFQLYKCPACFQPSLCRIGNAGEFLGDQLPADSLASVFTALQLVNSQQSGEGLPCTDPGSGHDPCQSANQPNYFHQLSSPDPRSHVLASSGPDESLVNSAPPRYSFTETSAFDFDFDPEREQKFSWPGSSWMKSLSTKSKPTSMPSRRMRLASSGSTSGYFSGSSVGSILDHSRDLSFRTSLDISNENDCGIWSTNQESLRHLAVGLPSSSTGSRASWVGRESHRSKVEEDRLNSNCANRIAPLTEGDSNIGKATHEEDKQLPDNPPSNQRSFSGTKSNQTSSEAGEQCSCLSTVVVSSEPRRKTLNVNRKGNIFLQRRDFNIFEKLPPVKRNAYFVYLDDDSCTGNEDTRAFLLAQLTHHRVSEVVCLACHCALAIYDHFPIVDGVLFLSPVCHQSAGGVGKGFRVNWYSHGHVLRAPPNTTAGDGCYGANSDAPGKDGADGDLVKCLLGDQSRPIIPPPGCLGPRQQLTVAGGGPDSNNSNTGGRRGAWSKMGGRQERYLHALCLDCVQEMTPSAPGAPEATSKIHCRVCGRPWSGAALLVGGLYTYDIFAASPCCLSHISCNSCGHFLDKQCLEALVPNSTPARRGSEAPREQTASMESLPLPFFSQYSQLITCPVCGKEDYHFVKPFEKYYQGIHHRGNR